MKTAQENNIDYFLSNRKDAKLVEYKDLKFVIYKVDIKGEDKPSFSVWKGKQKNPAKSYYYNTLERMMVCIEERKTSADSREEYKAQLKAEKKAFTPEINLGDIYVASWGYDQTNVNFYQVVSKKGKCTVVIKEIASKMVEGSAHCGMSCNVVAIKDSFLNKEDKGMEKRVGKYGISLASYSSASKWDGSEMYNSWGH